VRRKRHTAGSHGYVMSASLMSYALAAIRFRARLPRVPLNISRSRNDPRFVFRSCTQKEGRRSGNPGAVDTASPISPAGCNALEKPFFYPDSGKKSLGRGPVSTAPSSAAPHPVKKQRTSAA
jgi:hypothetical protein